MSNTYRILPELTPQQIARFKAKIPTLSSDECWEWQGACAADGYGTVFLYLNGKDRIFRAHRFAYKLHYGQEPGELAVCHRCDNRSCCNPTHLFLGTLADNNRDRTRKGRAARGDRNGARLHPERLKRGNNHPAHLHPENQPRGSDHPNAKLTEDAVREIRRRYKPVRGMYKALAREFGVDPALVRGIVLGKWWRHVI